MCFLANEEATLQYASTVAQQLRARGSKVVFLEGDLGAGKTTLTRGILRALGYHGAVKSPTYTLVEEYQVADVGWVYHFDLYRMEHPEELEYVGGRDYFERAALCLVEWPSRGLGWLPEPDLRIGLSVCRDGRQIALQWHNGGP